MLENNKVAYTHGNDAEFKLMHYQSKIAKSAQIETALKAIMSASVGIFDLDKVIKSIVTEAGRLFCADRCFFVEHDSETGFIKQVNKNSEYISSENIRPQSTRHIEQADIKAFIEMSKQKKTLFVEKIENVDLPEATRKMLVDDLSVKSYLAIPVFFGETKYGSLVFHYVDNHISFTQDDIEIAKVIVNHSAVVIHQAKLYKAMQMQASREMFLRELVSDISASLDSNEIRKIIVSKLGSALNSDLTILYILDKNSQKFLPIDEYSLHVASDDIKNPVGINVAEDYDWAKHIRENKKTDVVYSDIEQLKSDYKLHGTKPEEFLNEYKVKSMIAIPIIHAKTFLGFLVMNFIKEQKIITKADVNLVKVVANQAGITMYQSQLYLQAQEASKAKSEFIATMSHELKTPLNVIIGFSDLLSKTNVEPDKQIKYLQNINNSGKHLLNLTNDIINISIIESGTFELNYEVVDLTALIEEAVNSLKLISEDKKLKIDQQLMQAKIISDKKILTQIMYNLLSNAIKFTLEGGEIKVKLAIADTHLIISVEDTGIGIDSEHLDIIFENFKQIDSSLERKQEGAGLGLPITKKLVELLGGTIQVKSKKGEGSCFSCIFPYQNG